VIVIGLNELLTKLNAGIVSLPDVAVSPDIESGGLHDHEITVFGEVVLIVTGTVDDPEQIT
jgi:hypothetical protein